MPESLIQAIDARASGLEPSMARADWIRECCLGNVDPLPKPQK